jgi:hypothetical protein
MLKAIHAQESREGRRQKGKGDDLRASKMDNAADLVEEAARETLTHYGFRTFTDRISEPTIRWSGWRPHDSAHRRNDVVG